VTDEQVIELEIPDEELERFSALACSTIDWQAHPVLAIPRRALSDGGHDLWRTVTERLVAKRDLVLPTKLTWIRRTAS
jgi:hypothetical protein